MPVIRPVRGRVRALIGGARVAVWALVLAHCLAAAPAHGQAAPPGPATVPPRAAGTWAGVIAATSGRVDLTFQLVQEGDRVHGTYDYRGPVLVAINVRVTGTLRGNILMLFQEGGAAPVLEARVEGRSLTGLYRGGSAPLPFEATRVDPD